MGFLVMPETRDRADKASDAYRYDIGYYGCRDTVENLVRYIKREGEWEQWKEDLLLWGWCGLPCYTSEDVIPKMLEEQHATGIDIKDGGEIYHEIFYLPEEDLDDFVSWGDSIWMMAERCACTYFCERGFPVVYAFHCEPDKGYHIHFAISGRSFPHGYVMWDTSLTGTSPTNRNFWHEREQWRTTPAGIMYRNERFNKIMKECQAKEPAIEFLY